MMGRFYEVSNKSSFSGLFTFLRFLAQALIFILSSQSRWNYLAVNCSKPEFGQECSISLQTISVCGFMGRHETVADRKARTQLSQMQCDLLVAIQTIWADRNLAREPISEKDAIPQSQIRVVTLHPVGRFIHEITLCPTRKEGQGIQVFPRFIFSIPSPYHVATVVDFFLLLSCGALGLAVSCC